ncbi:MAG: DegT/DnrJ/EryC1/StrS aminotransferase family protein [Clostridia bacterium]|nr:DegT/DnrJ/EryC1/StrS aminotransferase family protein [Clostridia bacterium]MBQ1553943.1 DegT/DnrJ/EryC1/StrS aminotransferase family protein [Clostridia bacterium]
MSKQNIEAFCRKLGDRLGAAECMAFSGVTESMNALFEAFELGAMDAVFVSALAPCRLIKSILIHGAAPVLCDVAPDSLTMDPRALDTAVRQVVASGQLYPRAVIVDHFCGMPAVMHTIKSICDRMGLILIENCGTDFGGSFDTSLCGTSGDYALLSLGASSVFGTGGSGALIVSMGDSPLTEGISFCDGEGYQSVDPCYGETLLAAWNERDSVLAQSRAHAASLTQSLADSDFWVQRGSNQRQKSSFGSLAVISQSEEHRDRALAFLEKEGMSRFVRTIHVHSRSCFDKGCRGLKEIENATALAPRSIRLDIFGAIHADAMPALCAAVEAMGKQITE